MVEYLDRFIFETGKSPILIIGSHSFSFNYHSYPEGIDLLDKEKEKRLHLSDYLVFPVLQFLRNERNFYILENRIPRAIVDMNRHEARLFDNLDENDWFFRQMIRYVLNYIRNTHHQIPLVLDLHSFPRKSQYADDDIKILIQTKDGMKTNPQLVEFTLEYFFDAGFDVGSTSIHNQDDIVEEIAWKKLGVPILLEFNERFLSRQDSIEYLCLALEDYLLSASQKLHTKAFQYLAKPVDRNHSVSAHFDFLDNVKDTTGILKESYRQYVILKYFQKKTPEFIEQTKDALSTIIIPKRNVDKDVFELAVEILMGLSNSYNSSLVPIELLMLNIRTYYANLNKRFLEEWGINHEFLTQSLSQNRHYHGKEIIIIKTKTPARSLFTSPNINGEYFFGFFIFPDFAGITKKGISQDIKRFKELKGVLNKKDAQKIELVLENHMKI